MEFLNEIVEESACDPAQEKAEAVCEEIRAAAGIARPTDPVELLLPLASARGEWTTGMVIVVDGGYSNAL